jgi:hypothetical protein
MRIGIDEADELLHWLREAERLKDAECECDENFGITGPCAGCEALENGKLETHGIMTLIIGIGAALRQGADPSAYENVVLSRRDREIVQAAASHHPAGNLYCWGQLTDGLSKAITEDHPPEAYYDSTESWVAMRRIVIGREETACLLEGIRQLLRRRRIVGLEKRLRRLLKKTLDFDIVCVQHERVLIHINGLRKELREQIIVKGDWWWYRHDECVYDTCRSDLSDAEKSHIEACASCRRTRRLVQAFEAMCRQREIETGDYRPDPSQ